MAVSFFGFVIVFSPVVFVYLFPPSAVDENVIRREKGFFLSIPKIHAYATIVPNVDPWSEAEYKVALREGVAHAKGTFLPGEKGTIFLFAHSSGMPWEITRYNTIFLRLGELNAGDEIRVDYEKKLYVYTVVEKKEVWPYETQYLENTKKDQLILQTCTPIGTTLKRLLVFAEPKNN